MTISWIYPPTSNSCKWFIYRDSNKHVTSLKLTFLHLKMDENGILVIVSSWEFAYFQVRLLLVSGRVYHHQSLEQLYGLECSLSHLNLLDIGSICSYQLAYFSSKCRLIFIHILHIFCRVSIGVMFIFIHRVFSCGWNGNRFEYSVQLGRCSWCHSSNCWSCFP